jgi:hypothetical protein
LLFQGEGAGEGCLKDPEPLTSVLSSWVKGRGDKGQCLGSEFAEVDAIVMPALF